jgi:hypothetical protein
MHVTLQWCYLIQWAINRKRRVWRIGARSGCWKRRPQFRSGQSPVPQSRAKTNGTWTLKPPADLALPPRFKTDGRELSRRGRKTTTKRGSGSKTTPVSSPFTNDIDIEPHILLHLHHWSLHTSSPSDSALPLEARSVFFKRKNIMGELVSPPPCPNNSPQLV